MATPKTVGKRAWRREINRIYRTLTDMRQTASKLLRLVEQRPFPVRLAAIYVGQILAATGEANDALRELQQIVDEHPGAEG